MKEKILRTTRLEFLEVVENFLNKYEMSATTFGIKALNEPNFVFTLRNGRSCSEKIRGRVADFICNFKENGNE